MTAIAADLRLFLEDIRVGFSVYGEALKNYGADSLEDLKLLTRADIPALEAQFLELEPVPPILHQRLVLQALTAFIFTNELTTPMSVQSFKLLVPSHDRSNLHNACM